MSNYSFKALHCQYTIPYVCLNSDHDFIIAGVAKLVFVLYKHLGQFLSTENATLRGLGDMSKHNLSLTVNSHILSASITKESSRVFVTDPVIFTLEHLDVSLLLTHPQNTIYGRGIKNTEMAAQPFTARGKSSTEYRENIITP